MIMIIIVIVIGIVTITAGHVFCVSFGPVLAVPRSSSPTLIPPGFSSKRRE
ncbi:hypothetical protein F4809DRAFT_637681 [Biscogniauxia mediterranea]|nr:hypothetical protein F4809DRAFT_637681 [Biscogniauxia mediterranea]